MKRFRSILLIDDDAICSWLNKTLLEGLQIAPSITCVSSGQEALAYLQHAADSQDGSELPDLIFLDLNLPDMTGFQLIRKLKQLKGCETLARDRIVMLTTSMHLRDLGKANEVQLQGYLVKPLTETKVMTVVENLAGSRKGPAANYTLGTPAAADRIPAPYSSGEPATKAKNPSSTRQP